MRLVNCKSALTPHPTPAPVVYTADRSKAVVPVLLLFCVTLRFILRSDCYCVALSFVLIFFSPFSIAITTLREGRAGLCAFRAFVYFARIGLSLSLSPLRLGASWFLNEPSHLDLRSFIFSLSTLHIIVFPSGSLLK